MSALATISDIKIRDDNIDDVDFLDLLEIGSPAGCELFRPAIAGDYKYEKARLRMIMKSKAKDRPYITALNMLADTPDLSDRGRDTIGAAKTTITFGRAFNSADDLEVVAVQKGGTTYASIIVSNVTAVSFDIELRNSLDALVGGTISWSAEGR